MKKMILGGLAIAALLLAGGAASACDWCHGTGGRIGGGTPAAMKAFHKDTLSLRDELGARQIDLAEEYDREKADPARIAAIRKDIVDIEAKIQAAADKHGVRPWGGGRGHAMMASRSGHCGCR